MSIAKPNSVVVPVDFSTASFKAIDVAIEMAGSPECIHVVYVSPAPQSEADYLRTTLTQKSTDRAKSELEKKLDELGYAGVDAIVDEGVASDVIVATAEKLNAELIVIPSHSRSGLPKLFLGSVASQLLRAAPCPVLVLRRT